MAEIKPSRRTVETVAVLGIPLASRVVEEFNFQEYPVEIRKGLRKSAIPEHLYADALAVVGRAYGRVQANWTDENVGRTPELAWRVPTPEDFDGCVDNLREQVGVDSLVDLSDRLFGRTGTPEEILFSIRNELQMIFNPPDKERG